MSVPSKDDFFAALGNALESLKQSHATQANQTTDKPLKRCHSDTNQILTNDNSLEALTESLLAAFQKPKTQQQDTPEMPPESPFEKCSDTPLENSPKISKLTPHSPSGAESRENLSNSPRKDSLPPSTSLLSAELYGLLLKHLTDPQKKPRKSSQNLLEDSPDLGEERIFVPSNLEEKPSKKAQNGEKRGRNSGEKGGEKGGNEGNQGGMKFRGVRRRNSGRWISEIKDSAKNKRIWLGTFDSPEEAALAYDKKAVELRGSSAKLNFSTHNPPPKWAVERAKLREEQERMKEKGGVEGEIWGKVRGSIFGGLLATLLEGEEGAAEIRDISGKEIGPNLSTPPKPLEEISRKLPPIEFGEVGEDWFSGKGCQVSPPHSPRDTIPLQEERNSPFFPHTESEDGVIFSRHFAGEKEMEENWGEIVEMGEFQGEIGEIGEIGGIEGEFQEEIGGIEGDIELDLGKLPVPDGGLPLAENLCLNSNLKSGLSPATKAALAAAARLFPSANGKSPPGQVGRDSKGGNWGEKEDVFPFMAGVFSNEGMPPGAKGLDREVDNVFPTKLFPFETNQKAPDVHVARSECSTNRNNCTVTAILPQNPPRKECTLEAIGESDPVHLPDIEFSVLSLSGELQVNPSFGFGSEPSLGLALSPQIHGDEWGEENGGGNVVRSWGAKETTGQAGLPPLTGLDLGNFSDHDSLGSNPHWSDLKLTGSSPRIEDSGRFQEKDGTGSHFKV